MNEKRLRKIPQTATPKNNTVLVFFVFALGVLTPAPRLATKAMQREEITSK